MRHIPIAAAVLLLAAPAHAQMRLTIPAACAPLAAIEPALRRDGYRIAVHGIDREGDAFKVYVAPDGRWAALSLVSAADGTAMGCAVLSGARMLLGEGA